MNQVILRILIRLVYYIIKTGQVKNALAVALWAIQTKASYDEAMGRLDGSFYQKQVDTAVENYKEAHPNFETDVSGIPGMEKWLKEQGK